MLTQRPSVVLALLAGAAIAATIALWTPGLRVVDGDTVEHALWRWRIVGLDAPEIHRAACPAETALGERAAARLRALVAGGNWRLLPVAGRDRYGRKLAILEVDGADVAAVLIGEGLAHAYDGHGPRSGWCAAAHTGPPRLRKLSRRLAARQHHQVQRRPGGRIG